MNRRLIILAPSYTLRRSVPKTAGINGLCVKPQTGRTQTAHSRKAALVAPGAIAPVLRSRRRRQSLEGRLEPSAIPKGCRSPPGLASFAVGRSKSVGQSPCAPSSRLPSAIRLCEAEENRSSDCKTGNASALRGGALFPFNLYPLPSYLNSQL